MVRAEPLMAAIRQSTGYKIRVLVGLFLALSLCLADTSESREFRTIDPSGMWKSISYPR
jgi:hypothetical protein